VLLKKPILVDRVRLAEGVDFCGDLPLSLLKGSRLRAGLRLGGPCDLEPLIVFVPRLVFDVLFHRLLIHRAHARAEVSSRPQMLPPVPLSQLGELLLQFPGRPSL
jgi:hypothetical protein